ncbi:NAD(P)/FAD-dependent oxidoreductase [Mycolicibacterium pulveris]|uniref:flavin-containing monooxygenase n=1 Tax=Mycolicibacterium pulveris TaxID=36813 RepID=UPI0021F2FB52|nr:NAD(P)/FAD-dependent oxidoreductase [Mycolicibacterium pulveris]MCV6983534.1 NAD(P)/FAD-dependent oxidoreductase [Mycolicibacterium pulveris]
MQAAVGEGRRHHEVIIAGAGFGGLGVAVELSRIGITDFVILEKAHDLGGTWRDNTYPGLEVDIPSFTYSYHFELKPDWSQVYAPGREVKAYADAVADKYRLRPHIRYGAEVEGTNFDEETGVWTVRVVGGPAYTCRYFVAATGFLTDSKLPDIPGFEDFAGEVMHTSRWNHSYDFKGKNVAVIGTGATAIQVAPAIYDEVANLDIYQRTAIWLAPKPNVVFSDRTKALFRRFPILPRSFRVLYWIVTDLLFATGVGNYKRFPFVLSMLESYLISYIRKQVDDPEIQDKLIPDYNFFCKRPSFSNTFYKLFNEENVELVTEAIDHVDEKGLVTKDGTLRLTDVIICATGFRVYDRRSTPGFEIVGRGGKNLGEWWEQNRYQAFLGTTIPDFPNFFMIVGPYAAAGADYFGVLNNQVAHISRVLRAARKRGANVVEVKWSAHDRDFRLIEKRKLSTVYFAGDCRTSNSYYFDSRGDTPVAPRPVTPTRHWLKSRLFNIKRAYNFQTT